MQDNIDQSANMPNAPVANDVPEQPKENMMAVGVNEKKSGKGMLIGLVLCLLLAAGGIGFGVWAMMDGNAQKDGLNTQISSLKQQINSLQDQLDNSDTIIDIDTESDVDTADYIYIGEWGIKIKIPELLKGNISYIFTGDSIEIIDVSGYSIDSANIDNMGYLKISRSETGEIDFENCEVSCTELFVTIDGFDYFGGIIGGDLTNSRLEALREMVSTDSFSAI